MAKMLETGGITYIELIPGGTDEWYYGISYEHGDLYEAEEVFRDGQDIEGRNLCLIHYPDGKVFNPVTKQSGVYPGEPVFYDGNIYITAFQMDLTTSTQFRMTSRFLICTYRKKRWLMQNGRQRKK